MRSHHAKLSLSLSRRGATGLVRPASSPRACCIEPKQEARQTPWLGFAEAHRECRFVFSLQSRTRACCVCRCTQTYRHVITISHSMAPGHGARSVTARNPADRADNHRLRRPGSFIHHVRHAAAHLTACDTQGGAHPHRHPLPVHTVPLSCWTDHQTWERASLVRRSRQEEGE